LTEPLEWFCTTSGCLFRVKVTTDATWAEVAPADKPLESMISGRQEIAGSFYCDSCAKKTRTQLQDPGKEEA